MVRGPESTGERLAELRGRLAEIAASPEFAPREPGFLERLQDQVLEWIGRLLGALFGEGAGESLLAWAVFGLVAVLVGVLAWTIGRRMLRLAPRRRGASTDSGLQVASGAPPPSLAEARELATSGRWRDAGEAVYAAVLAQLGRAGRLQLREEKTPGEYRRELETPEVRTAFGDLVQRLDPVLWGGRDGDRERFDGWLARARELGVSE